MVFLLLLSSVVKFKQNHASFLKIIIKLVVSSTSLPGPFDCTHLFKVPIQVFPIYSNWFHYFVAFILNLVGHKDMIDKSIAFSLFFCVNKCIRVNQKCKVIDVLKITQFLSLLAVKHHNLLACLQMQIVEDDRNIREDIVTILALFKLYLTLLMIDILNVQKIIVLFKVGILRQAVFLLSSQNFPLFLVSLFCVLLRVVYSHADIFVFWFGIHRFCDLGIELSHVLLMAVLIDECAGRVVETLSVQDIQYFIDLFDLLYLLGQKIQQFLSLMYGDNLRQVQMQFYFNSIFGCVFGELIFEYGLALEGLCGYESFVLDVSMSLFQEFCQNFIIFSGKRFHNYCFFALSSDQAHQKDHQDHQKRRNVSEQ